MAHGHGGFASAPERNDRRRNLRRPERSGTTPDQRDVPVRATWPAPRQIRLNPEFGGSHHTKGLAFGRQRASGEVDSSPSAQPRSLSHPAILTNPLFNWRTCASSFPGARHGRLIDSKFSGDCSIGLLPRQEHVAPRNTLTDAIRFSVGMGDSCVVARL